jgi:hypothetical protein
MAARAERQAYEIRLRAEQRARQLLRAMEKGAAQPGVGRRGEAGMVSHDTTPLADLGISRDQSAKWQKLAAVPDAEFEHTLTAPGPMSPTDSISTHAEP